MHERLPAAASSCSGSGKTPLKLGSVTTLGTGVVVLSYQPVKA
jgi:hypothetical protein